MGLPGGRDQRGAVCLRPGGAGGRLLAGHYTLLAFHKQNATFTAVTAVVMTVVAVLRRGPLWPVFISAGLVATLGVQIALGYSRILAIHIPLGVSIITAIVLLAVWAWKPINPPPAAPTEPDLGATVRPYPPGTQIALSNSLGTHSTAAVMRFDVSTRRAVAVERKVG